MSCALSVAARDDVAILPDLVSLDKTEYGQLEALWNRLRITSVDAANHTTVTVREFAKDYCLYFACLVKHGDRVPVFVPPPSSFSPVDSSWAAPTSLGIQPSDSKKPSLGGVSDTCAAALDELRRRTLSFRLTHRKKGEEGNIGVDVDLLGDLIKVAAVTVFSDGKCALCGLYLFQNALLFVFQDTTGALFVHRFIALSRVNAATMQREGTRGVDVIVFDDRNARQTIYSFVVDGDNQAREWCEAIETATQTFNTRDVPLHSTLQTLADHSEDRVVSGSVNFVRAQPLLGIVFLASSTSGEQEANLGVCVARESEGRGLGTYMVSHALSLAFDTLGYHRVQARIMHPVRPADAPFAIRAEATFIRWGFTHEGTRRRGLIHPHERSWTDETILAVLDSDWAIRDSVRPAPQTLWDEMFTRHQRERESLLQWEGGNAALKHTKSMETVRDLKALEDAAPPSDSASTTSAAVSLNEEPMDEDDVNSLPPSSVVDSASSWDAVSQTSIESVTKRVEHWSAAAAADDAADEDASWDDFEGDDDDELMDEEEDAK
ncbi:hypothetical protein EXIGLDRAFT_833329 [Exidia glandulosa HHB12029]|uniref:N-acetyltransferase domain-containing protein n=1 Tax=Exidia glandulosa HHB12029 TaxID=1314781 RepID=A0A165KUI7_EXIGL|nr:hypothetical protein EXIGLDRAFT_833329 [Exidia glandulosa HHB12029]